MLCEPREPGESRQFGRVECSMVNQDEDTRVFRRSQVGLAWSSHMLGPGWCAVMDPCRRWTGLDRGKGDHAVLTWQRPMLSAANVSVAARHDMT